jgi:hypothetical protein
MKKQSLFSRLKLQTSVVGFVFCAASNVQADNSQAHMRDEISLLLQMNTVPLAIKCTVEKEYLNFLPLISFEGEVDEWSSNSNPDAFPPGRAVRIKTVLPSEIFQTREGAEIECGRRVDILEKRVRMHFQHLWLTLIPNPDGGGEFFWNSGKIFSRFNLETVKIEPVN